MTSTPILLLLFALLPTDCVAACGRAGDEAGADTELEKAMQQRPGDAFQIARQAADGQSPRQAKSLFVRAAVIQEKHLNVLNQSQIVELASVYQSTLADVSAADRVRGNWLKHRELIVDAGDAKTRLELAKLRWSWLHEREAAARLCQDALRINPHLSAAEQMLRDHLGYRWLAGSWTPVEKSGLTEKGAEVQIGMTMAEVERLKGRPSRIARQILDGRYLEQWQYTSHPGECITLMCRRGEDARVQSVQRTVVGH